MDRLLQDVRYALRNLMRRPLFAVVAALSLAVGVGANTAIFSAVNALLLRPVPGVEEPERVVEIGRSRPDGSGFDSFAYPDFLDLREEVAAFEAMSAYSFATFSFSQGGEGERVMGLFADPSYLDVMGVRPAMGRSFAPEEDAPGSRAAVALVTHDFWVRALGATPDPVGTTLRINRVSFEVVGVLPPGFRGHTAAVLPDVILPLHARVTLGDIDEALFGSRGSSWHQAVARLAPGATREQADAQVRAVYARLAEAHPDTNAQRSGRVVALGLVPGGGRGPVTAFLSVLMGMVVLILLVTCANVAGMFVARAGAREKEMAVRLSLGAGRGRLVQQLLTESLIVFLVGGAAGSVAGVWALGLLRFDRLPLPVPVQMDLSPDPGVLLFALAVTSTTGLVFGLLPALQATRADLVPALKDEGRGRSGSGRLRRAFVAAQVGLSLVLLVSAGLLLRSLQRASEVETGFDPTGAWLSGVDLAKEGYGPDEGAVLQRRLLESVSGLPGVTSAALAIDLPLDLGSHGTVAHPEGWSGAEGRDYVGVDFNYVTPDYFATLAIPVLEGRDFTPEEGIGTAPVVAVSRTFADRVWPEGSALGRRLRVGLPEVEEEWRTVVAVVEDVKNQMLTDTPEPFVYLPLWQAYRPDTRVVVRFRTEEPAGVTAQMRDAILAVDGSLSVEPVISLARVTSLGTLPQRVAASVTSVLGLLALLLAALGVYGVVAFAVTQRTREIGVRMALGAGRNSVVGLILRDGLLLALPGLLVGAVGAAGVGYLLRFLLLGLSPADPVALAGVTATLVGVVVAASLVPGRRAAGIEPVEALRSE